jgi:hypothetical protein
MKTNFFKFTNPSLNLIVNITNQCMGTGHFPIECRIAIDSPFDKRKGLV